MEIQKTEITNSNAFICFGMRTASALVFQCQKTLAELSCLPKGRNDYGSTLGYSLRFQSLWSLSIEVTRPLCPYENCNTHINSSRVLCCDLNLSIRKTH